MGNRPGGFTGTRWGMTDRQKAALVVELQARLITDFHHGDCVGADEEADEIARLAGCHIHIHPPEDDKLQAFCFRKGDTIYEPKPYLARNDDIIAAAPVLIGAPVTMKHPHMRSGTWYTIRHAKAAGKIVVVLEP